MGTTAVFIAVIGLARGRYYMFGFNIDLSNEDIARLPCDAIRDTQGKLEVEYPCDPYIYGVSPALPAISCGQDTIIINGASIIYNNARNELESSSA